MGLPVRSRAATRRKRVLVVGLAIAIIGGACTRPPRRIDPNAYAKEIEQWRSQRLANLTSENGWLTLIGLFWLKDGRNTLGSETGNDIVLPKEKLPARAGAFTLANGVVSFVTPLANTFMVDGQPVTSLQLKSDADDKPTVLTLGSVTFQIIKRNDKLGVRVKDKNNPDRTNFAGLENYPADLKWRIDARFEPYNPPKAMPILNVLGMESDEPSPGAVVFEVDGKSYRLDAVTEEGESQFFMIFADDTRGKETYGAGRYLYVDPPDASGRVIIDFNKAYSPPCAFTNYATCPLPPKQNVLPIAIEAGEKYKGHSS
jgi:uncharacterized protein